MFRSFLLTLVIGTWHAGLPPALALSDPTEPAQEAPAKATPQQQPPAPSPVIPAPPPAPAVPVAKAPEPTPAPVAEPAPQRRFRDIKRVTETFQEELPPLPPPAVQTTQRVTETVTQPVQQASFVAGPGVVQAPATALVVNQPGFFASWGGRFGQVLVTRSQPWAYIPTQQVVIQQAPMVVQQAPQQVVYQQAAAPPVQYFAAPPPPVASAQDCLHHPVQAILNKQSSILGNIFGR